MARPVSGSFQRRLPTWDSSGKKPASFSLLSPSASMCRSLKLDASGPSRISSAHSGGGGATLPSDRRSAGFSLLANVRWPPRSSSSSVFFLFLRSRLRSPRRSVLLPSTASSGDLPIIPLTTPPPATQQQNRKPKSKTKKAIGICKESQSVHQVLCVN